jgi:hypothetical protein
MSTGLAVPTRTNTGGGMLLGTGKEQDQTTIKLALGDDYSDNPWQQSIGLGVQHIYAINDSSIRPIVLSRLIPMFQRFEALKRFKLRRETMRWDDGDEGEHILTFKYIDLETDEEHEFRQSFQQSDGSSNPGTV